jgi:hypothetical protein
MKIQLLIELAIDGRKLPNIHRLNAPYHEMLERLKRSNAAWEALTPTFSFDIRVHGERFTWEVGDGLFATGALEDSSGRAEKISAIEFWELQDGVYSTEMRRVINHSDLGLNIVNFSFDRVQDLLVYVENRYTFLALSQNYDVTLTLPRRPGQYTLHLRTLSTNEPHPRAAEGGIELSGPDKFDGCKIRIWDDMVGCLLQDYDGMDNVLSIADWPRSILIAVSNSQCLNRNNY